MKTLLQLLSILFITLSFTACGGGGGTNPDSNSSIHKVSQIISGEDLSISAAELNAIEGVSGAVVGRDYITAIKEGSYADSTNPTPAEIQTIIESVNAAAENHSPTTQNLDITTNEDTSKSFTLTGSDAEGDALTYTLTTSPSHGSLTGTAPSLTYTPTANYHGSDSFKYQVCDTHNACSTEATVTITVTSVNDAPLASAGEDVIKREGETVTLDAADSSDSDGSISSYKWTEGGTLLSSSVSFSKSDFAVGIHTITLTVTDNENTTATDTVTITILSQDAIASCIETNSDLGYANAGIYTSKTIQGTSTDTKIRVWHLSNGDKKSCVIQGSAQQQ